MSSPTEPTTGIEDLPWEMISELFEYLHPKDLAACSMVNRRWHSIYSNFKVHSLAVVGYNPYGHNPYSYEPRKWYHSNQTILDKEAVSPAVFGRLFEKPLLSNLKHLALYCQFEFDLNKLNRFPRLLHLEIGIKVLREARVNLNLPKLKVLAFDEWNLHCALSTDCPLLNTLLYASEQEDANLLEVKQPETIRKLETNMVSPKWLAQFKDVECLVTDRFEAINKATLLSLPRLRELRYNLDMQGLFRDESRFGHTTLDLIKPKLIEFLDEAEKLRGSDFRFTFIGFQLTNVNVDQIDFGVQVDEDGFEWVCNEYVYLKNYHLIEPGALPFVDHINYPLLLSHVTGEFPRCFSQKFTGINFVRASAEVPDADHFLWFLKSLRSLRGLELEETWLSQEFYDQLPASARSLTMLRLNYRHCEDGLQLNFEFIGRLSRLSGLELLAAVSLEELPSLVRSLCRLAKCTFGVQSREEPFEIWKGRDNLTEWNIFKAGQLLLETENSEEIVNFFEDLQDDAPVSSSDSDWSS